MLGTLAGFGKDAVVRAVDGGVGHQLVLGQVVEQHVEAEDVVGHQQLGGRGGRLRGQAFAQRIRLLVHGLLELQAHHTGIDDQGQGDQDHVMAGDAQCNRYTAVAQCPEDQQEEVIGFYWRGPVHLSSALLSVKLTRSIATGPRPSKRSRCPMVTESG
ncbi:hypothetical protein D3C72_1404580 [compost metagenome]